MVPDDRLQKRPRVIFLFLSVALLLVTGCSTLESCAAEKDREKQDTANYFNDQDYYNSMNGQPSSGNSSTKSGGDSSAANKPAMDIGNPKAVQNGGTSPEWSPTQSMKVSEITTYHWNNGQGAEPGTIALESDNGRTFGPWQTSGLPGQGGVSNASWVAKPNVVVPPGTYKVIDSDPSTWAQNADSEGVGFTTIVAAPAR